MSSEISQAENAQHLRYINIDFVFVVEQVLKIQSSSQKKVKSNIAI